MRARALGGLTAAAIGVALVVSMPASLHHLREAGAVLVSSKFFDLHPAPTVTPGDFSARTFTENGVSIKYSIFFPQHYDASKKWPVVVALHGSQEKGEDGVKQLTRGLAPYVKAQSATFPAVVIFPQVPSASQGVLYGPMLMDLIRTSVRDVNGDPARVSLTGLSFGGIIAYDMARRNPGYFAALVPISAPVVMQAGARYTRLPNAEAFAIEAQGLQSTPVWIFQGAHDEAVPVADTRQMVQTYRSAGVIVKYTEYADGTHDIWDRAYRSPELWSWLLEQHR